MFQIRNIFLKFQIQVKYFTAYNRIFNKLEITSYFFSCFVIERVFHFKIVFFNLQSMPKKALANQQVKVNGVVMTVQPPFS